MEAEMEAWRRGWSAALEEFPELQVLRRKFEERRDQCVATYEQRDEL